MKVRTLKTQLRNVVKNHTNIKSIKEAQTMFEEKVKFYNEEKKVAKAFGLTPLQGRQADSLKQAKADDEPSYALAFNHPLDKHNQEIVTLKKQKALFFRQRTPIDKLENTEQNVLQIRKEMKEQHQVIFDVVNDIKERVSKKDKVFRKHLPLRDPATGTVFDFILRQPKKKYEKITSFYVFRIAITLLRHTGLRVSEIMDLNKEQISTFIKEKRLQVYQSKQNKYREILLTEHALEDLQALREEIRYVFCKRLTLANGVLRLNWVSFINEKLIDAAKHFNINLKSHSFRVNKITTLLRLAPVQKVSFIMGHKDIRSTMAYNRYDLDQKETRALLEKASRDELTK